ncbi:GAL1 Galactokinase [Candida maltosa Xu316]
MDAKFCHSWDGNDATVGIEQLTEMINWLKKINKPERVFHRRMLSRIGHHCQRISFSIPGEIRYLKLYQRAKHVYKESLRVLKTLKLISTATYKESFLIKFGRMMNESQVDLDELNESSNKKLNELCSVALANGSYGSRVTGADGEVQLFI